MTAFYNELDPYAAQWLRNLIDAGHIAPGVVDTRSIEDIAPDELRDYTQVHFFAGVGGWSYALRLAGWPDNRPVWTGSCPCQPFSSAGKGAGFDDERHLWPHFHWLIQQCQPETVFGEQVASKDGLTWIDAVHADLEGTGYASAALDLCAAGVGAPHIRQRLYWMAHRPRPRLHWSGDTRTSGRDEFADVRTADGMGNTTGERREGQRLQHIERAENPQTAGSIETGGLEHPSGDGRQGWLFGREDSERQAIDRQAGCNRSANTALQVNGFWRDADWLGCRDGVWRPVEPGTFPLVNGATARVGRLRAYGNAIVAPLAQAFIEAAVAAIQEVRP